MDEDNQVYDPGDDKALPDSLSGLLELAIDNALSLDRDQYDPVCWETHVGCGEYDDGKTRIGISGALMAGTLGVAVDATLGGADVINDERQLPRRMQAAKDVSTGHIRWALAALRGCVTDTDVERLDASMSMEQMLLDGRWTKSWGDYPFSGKFKDWDEFDAMLPHWRRLIADLRRVGL